LTSGECGERADVKRVMDWNIFTCLPSSKESEVNSILLKIVYYNFGFTELALEFGGKLANLGLGRC
jgi:hypothetical protein